MKCPNCTCYEMGRLSYKAIGVKAVFEKLFTLFVTTNAKTFELTCTFYLQVR